MTHPAVIVIGAGPVGQTTALLLARWGLSVTLLDAATRRTAIGSRSICQQRDVLDIWNHLGATAIADEGLTWTTARTFHQGRHIATWSFPTRPGTPPFVNISQARTEAVLDRHIADQRLIRQHWNQPVTAIEQTGEHVTVHTPHATHHSRYAVLATGSHSSPLRDQLDIAFPGTTYDDQFLICDIHADLPTRNERHFHFDPPTDPGRQILIHPCPGNTYRIDWQVDTDYRPTRDNLDNRIRAVIGTDRYRLLWNTTYRFHSRVATRLTRGRILLAGDAAHLYAPFGARGLNSGVADAENLAWKIAAHHHGWADDTILDTYHTERHAAALENQQIVDTTMRFLAPATPADRHHRDTVLTAAANNPAAAADIDSGRFAEPYWYPDSPLTTPDDTRPPATRPLKNTPQPAAPGVIFPDGPAAGLRPTMRGTFTLVTREPVDARWFHDATPAPTRHLAMAELDDGDDLADAIGLAPGEAWLVRPDAHLAATIPDATPELVTAALHRALGHPTPDTELTCARPAPGNT